MATTVAINYGNVLQQMDGFGAQYMTRFVAFSGYPGTVSPSSSTHRGHILGLLFGRPPATGCGLNIVAGAGITESTPGVSGFGSTGGVAYAQDSNPTDTNANFAGSPNGGSLYTVAGSFSSGWDTNHCDTDWNSWINAGTDLPSGTGGPTGATPVQLLGNSLYFYSDNETFPLDHSFLTRWAADLRDNRNVSGHYPSGVGTNALTKYLYVIARYVVAQVRYQQITMGRTPAWYQFGAEATDGNASLLAHALDNSVTYTDLYPGNNWASNIYPELSDLVGKTADALAANNMATLLVTPSGGTATSAYAIANYIWAHLTTAQKVKVGAFGYHPGPYHQNNTVPPYSTNWDYLPNILAYVNAGNSPDATWETGPRQNLASLASANGKHTWMTATVYGGTEGQGGPYDFDTSTFDGLRARAQHVHDELLYARCSAFLYQWMYSTVEVNDYRDSPTTAISLANLIIRGSSDGCVVGDPAANSGAGDYRITTGGYAVGHYARWIQPGDWYIGSTVTDTAQTGQQSFVQVSSFKTARNSIVVVAINHDTSSRAVTFNISGSSISGNVTGEQTTGTGTGNNTVTSPWNTLTPFAVSSSSSFAATLPARSVTTFVVSTAAATTTYSLATNIASITGGGRTAITYPDVQGYVASVTRSTGGNATGTVTLSVDGGAPVTVASGTIANSPFKTPLLKPGSHTLALAFTGSGSDAGGTASQSFNIQIGGLLTSINIQPQFVNQGTTGTLTVPITSTLQTTQIYALAGNITWKFAGCTNQVAVFYDQSLDAAGSSASNCAGNCVRLSDTAYSTLQNWYGTTVSNYPIMTLLLYAPNGNTTGGGGAFHGGDNVLYCDISYTDARISAGLFVAEATEYLMAVQNPNGFNQGGSQGEALSRFHAERCFLGVMEPYYHSASSWLAGQTAVSLTWGAAGTSLTNTLTDSLGDAPQTLGGTSGTLSVAPLQQNTYTLTVASTGNPSATATATVVRDQRAATCWINASALQITSGSSVTLTWQSFFQVSGAGTATLKVGNAAPVSVSPSNASPGTSYTLTQQTTFVLTATETTTGYTTSASLTVGVGSTPGAKLYLPQAYLRGEWLDFNASDQDFPSFGCGILFLYQLLSPTGSYNEAQITQAIAASSQSTWAHVQDNPGGGALTSPTTTGTSFAVGAFPSAVTIGNYVFVGATGILVDNSQTLTTADFSCTDNATTPNTYTVLGVYKETAGDRNGWVALLGAKITQNPASGNLNPTLSLTSTKTTNICLGASEFSGGSLNLDGSPLTLEWDYNPSPVTLDFKLTTATANDLVLGIFAENHPGTFSWTPPAGFTPIGTQPNGTSFNPGQFIYGILSGAATNQDLPWTMTGTTNTTLSAMLVAIKPAGGVAAGTVNTLAGLYASLTGNSASSAWPAFVSATTSAFPVGGTYNLNDNLWVSSNPPPAGPPPGPVTLNTQAQGPNSVSLSIDGGPLVYATPDTTGTARFTLPNTLSAGTHSLALNYLGYGPFAPSSQTQTLTVNPSSAAVRSRRSGFGNLGVFRAGSRHVLTDDDWAASAGGAPPPPPTASISLSSGPSSGTNITVASGSTVTIRCSSTSATTGTLNGKTTWTNADNSTTPITPNCTVTDKPASSTAYTFSVSGAGGNANAQGSVTVTGAGQARSTAAIPDSGLEVLPPAWQANHSYTIGTMVSPSTDNGRVYRCVYAGVSGGTEPVWTTGAGSTPPTDGAVVWIESTYADHSVILQWFSTEFTLKYTITGASKAALFGPFLQSQTPITDVLGNPQGNGVVLSANGIQQTLTLDPVSALPSTEPISSIYQIKAWDSSNNVVVKPLSFIVQYNPAVGGTDNPNLPALDPTQAATVTTTKSGAWTDPTVWQKVGTPPSFQGLGSDNLPDRDSIVLIKSGHTITYGPGKRNGQAGRIIFQDNTAALNLSSAIGQNTALYVTDINAGADNLSQGGNLFLDSRSGGMCVILFRNRVKHANDTADIWRAARFYSGATLRMYGPVVTPYSRLAGDAHAGDTSLTLLTPVNWTTIGTKLYIPDTRQIGVVSGSGQVDRGEVVVLAGYSADGLTLYLKDPLAYDHLGARDGNGNPDTNYTFNGVTFNSTAHVANLIRSCALISTDPTTIGSRAHVAIGDNATLDLDGASLHGLGRTTQQPINAVNNPAERFCLYLDELYGPSGGVPTPNGFVRSDNGQALATRVNGANSNIPYQYWCNNTVMMEPWPVVTAIAYTPPFTSPATPLNQTIYTRPDGQARGAIWVKNSHYGYVGNNVCFNWVGSGITLFGGNESYNLVEKNLICAISSLGGGHAFDRFGGGAWIGGQYGWFSGFPYILRDTLRFFTYGTYNGAAGNGHMYVCTQSGTSSGSAFNMASWPTNGTTYTDGTVIWLDAGLIPTSTDFAEVGFEGNGLWWNCPNQFINGNIACNVTTTDIEGIPGSWTIGKGRLNFNAFGGFGLYQPIETGASGNGGAFTANIPTSPGHNPVTSNDNPTSSRKLTVAYLNGVSQCADNEAYACQNGYVPLFLSASYGEVWNSAEAPGGVIAVNELRNLRTWHNFQNFNHYPVSNLKLTNWHCRGDPYATGNNLAVAMVDIDYVGRNMVLVNPDIQGCQHGVATTSLLGLYIYGQPGNYPNIGWTAGNDVPLTITALPSGPNTGAILRNWVNLWWRTPWNSGQQNGYSPRLIEVKGGVLFDAPTVGSMPGPKVDVGQYFNGTSDGTNCIFRDRLFIANYQHPGSSLNGQNLQIFWPQQLASAITPANTCSPPTWTGGHYGAPTAGLTNQQNFTNNNDVSGQYNPPCVAGALIPGTAVNTYAAFQNSLDPAWGSSFSNCYVVTGVAVP